MASDTDLSNDLKTLLKEGLSLTPEQEQGVDATAEKIAQAVDAHIKRHKITVDGTDYHPA